MKPQVFVIVMSAIAAIWGARALELGALATFGLVLAAMIAGVFVLRFFSRRSSGS